jgi:hypothetical protein
MKMKKPKEKLNKTRKVNTGSIQLPPPTATQHYCKRTEDILTLKRLQEKFLKEALRNKRQKTTDAFFCKKHSEMKP